MGRGLCCLLLALGCAAGAAAEILDKRATEEGQQDHPSLRQQTPEEAAAAAEELTKILKEKEQQRKEAEEKIKVTFADHDEFEYIPRTHNEILAMQEEAEWLGGMQTYRMQNTATRMHLRCDVCYTLRALLHTALDGLAMKHKGQLSVQFIDQHFYHGTENFCLNMTDEHELLLDKPKEEGGLAIPKYIRGRGPDTLRGGWPEAFFFMTCEDMMHALTSPFLLRIAKARADPNLKWGADGELDICETRYRCRPSMDSERKQWAVEMKEQGFPDNFWTRGVAKMRDYTEADQEEMQRLLRERVQQDEEDRKERAKKRKGGQKPADDTDLKGTPGELTKEQALELKSLLEKVDIAHQEAEELELATKRLIDQREQLRKHLLKLRRQRQKEREKAAGAESSSAAGEL
eukprot:TRINITY_DN7046_c0_g1_i1.p1 TRINITY_DN7046_c0_g1~~TRINITY_DN7046_c0_g1_i1.p1  ORF type:complete len:428 (+),score=217.43 TRINITY_DN7046_c0_g1_i1:75-1286(+)